MQLVDPKKIIMADLQGDRSYLLVFATTDGSYEICLPGAGWPGAFAGYMTPSIRDQATGESRELPWLEAQELAAQLSPLLSVGNIAKGGEPCARECLETLAKGKRYGSET